MPKAILIIFFFLSLFLYPKHLYAASNSFVTVVNPVRGGDFWELNNQKPAEALLGQIEVLNKFNIPATWLIRPDALTDKSVLGTLKKTPNTHKFGLFLEITPSWASRALVKYNKLPNWHDAASVFLTGYEVEDRKKLIDSAFEAFKGNFGFYPKSVGAWFIDSNSLLYMYEKYKIDAALIVSDQYSTDNYQIWGQYWGYPYYPQKKHTLLPAQNAENKIPVVITQWAPRDPVNGYGKAVEESTYSVQPNDYIDYHDLDINYFSKLLEVYLKQEYNRVNQIVVGLENSYSWDKYQDEYKKQIEILAQKQKKGELKALSLEDFAAWYKNEFPDLSPPQILIATDPLGSRKTVVWFANQFYRAAWFYNQEGSLFRDIRQYLDNQEEMCFKISCSSLNFATSATRVLDEVSFGSKWILDEGVISDVTFNKAGENFGIRYKNSAGKNRAVEFLPRDISIDGRISSIDAAILNAVERSAENQKISADLNTNFAGNFLMLSLDFLKFLVFVFFVIFIPGFVILKKVYKTEKEFIQQIFLSICTGVVWLALFSYIAGFLNLYFLVYFLPPLFLLYFWRYQKNIKNLFVFEKSALVYLVIILIGVAFQIIPTIRSGLVFDYGMGFWGPNSHDGLWHLSLAKELAKGLPAQNPIFSGEQLKNYHYLYDLLVAITAKIAKIEAVDLIFRFYPILLSLLLGFGVISLIKNLKVADKKYEFWTVIFSLYFTYFAGSFGWIVTLLKEKIIAGESAFWANQAVSFNLNPPFGVSLVLILAIFIILYDIKKKFSFGKIFVAAAFIGVLVGFKAYGALLIFFLLGFFSLWEIAKKSFRFIFVTLFSSLIALVIYLPNFKFEQNFMYSPFWLIHAMVDSPDRLGWFRLSLARMAAVERGEWLKFAAVEGFGFLIFLFGNLGIRFLGLFGLMNIKRLKENFLRKLIFIFSLFSILLPVVFIQAGTPWNTIQFIYYFLYLAAIFAGITTAWIFIKLPIAFKFLFTLLIIIITPLNSLSTAKGYFYHLPHAFISSKELEALKFLEKKEEGIILTYPYDSNLKFKIAEPYPVLVYDTTAYVSAISGKRVFLEDETQNQILGSDYKKRRVEAKEFFLNSENPDMDFLKRSKVKYIYLPKLFGLDIQEKKGLEKAFENDGASIYMVN